jgi:hypothetical protein
MGVKFGPSLSEEQRLRVSVNRVWRRIFAHTGDDGTGDWRKLHNEVKMYFKMDKNGKNERSVQDFGWDNLKRLDRLGDLNLDERIIFKRW